MNRMVIVFVILSLLMIAISFWSNGKEEDQKAIQLEADIFKTTSVFKIVSLVVVALLIAIYTMWW